MNEEPDLLRIDRVEVYPDRNGRLPHVAWTKQTGTLALVGPADKPRVVLSRAGVQTLTAELRTVRAFGVREAPFGIKPIARRALRLELAGQRIILCFTGHVTDLSRAAAELQIGRLLGDPDPLTGAVELWRNRHFWRRSLDAADAWRGLLHVAPVRKTQGPRRRPAERGGAGVGARYSDRFKQQAVATARASDRPITAVARELEISPTTLHRWVRESVAPPTHQDS